MKRGLKMKTKLLVLKVNDQFEYPEPLSDELKEKATTLEFKSVAERERWIDSNENDMIMLFDDEIVLEFLFVRP